MNQSDLLSIRAKERVNGGRHLNDESKVSDNVLLDSIREIIPYCEEKLTPFGYKVVFKPTITLFECQTIYHKNGGPIPDDVNKKVYMKPDGGILYAVKGNQTVPFLMSEDKIQGTNDTLFEKNMKRQSTGNAIERGAKNIRGAEMVFSGRDDFPYVMFVQGCDLHHTETISSRLVMMNMGTPNHYIEITPTVNVDSAIDAILPAINIKKMYGRGIATICIKAHKWNEMKHGSSNWSKSERIKILKKVIDLTIASFTS